MIRTTRRVRSTTLAAGLAVGAVILGAVPALANFTSFSPPLTGGSDFATGFPTCSDNIGPTGLIADGSNLFAVDRCNQTTYKLPATGGDVSSATSLRNGLTLGLAVSNGTYFGIASNSGNTFLPVGLYSFSPTTLAVGSLLAAFPCTPLGLAADPISTDLYVGTACGIYRVQNPTSASPGVTHFAQSTDGFDGVFFSADGQHLWAADSSAGAMAEFSRSGSVEATVADAHGADGAALVRADAPPAVANNVFVNNNDGTIVRIDTNNGNAVSVVATGGSRGDLDTVDPNNCLYATQSDRVVKLAPCMFQPVTKITTTTTLTSAPNPSAFLQPVTLTADVTSTAGPCTAGTVTYTTRGLLGGTVNLGTAPTNNGVATLTTRALFLGDDVVTATFTPSNGGCIGSAGTTTQQVYLIYITLSVGGTTLSIELPQGITVGPTTQATHPDWTCTPDKDGKNQTCTHELGQHVRASEALPDIDLPVNVNTAHGQGAGHARLAHPTAPDSGEHRAAVLKVATN